MNNKYIVRIILIIIILVLTSVIVVLITSPKETTIITTEQQKIPDIPNGTLCEVCNVCGTCSDGAYTNNICDALPPAPPSFYDTKCKAVDICGREYTGAYQCSYTPQESFFGYSIKGKTPDTDTTQTLPYPVCNYPQKPLPSTNKSAAAIESKQTEYVRVRGKEEICYHITNNTDAIIFIPVTSLNEFTTFTNAADITIKTCSEKGCK